MAGNNRGKLTDGRYRNIKKAGPRRSPACEGLAGFEPTNGLVADPAEFAQLPGMQFFPAAKRSRKDALAPEKLSKTPLPTSLIHHNLWRLVPSHGFSLILKLSGILIPV
jgi:hypothetical protein